MKISEMNTEQTLKFMGRVIKPLKKIIQDGNIFDKVKSSQIKVDENISKEEKQAIMTKNGMNIISEFIECATNDFTNEIIEIMAAINFKTTKEIKQENGLKVILDFKEAMTDKEFIDFFTSLMK